MMVKFSSGNNTIKRGPFRIDLQRYISFTLLPLIYWIAKPILGKLFVKHMCFLSIITKGPFHLKVSTNPAQFNLKPQTLRVSWVTTVVNKYKRILISLFKMETADKTETNSTEKNSKIDTSVSVYRHIVNIVQRGLSTLRLLPYYPQFKVISDRPEV